MSVRASQHNFCSTDERPSNILDFLVVLTGPAVVPANARAFVSSMVRWLTIDSTVDLNEAPSTNIWAAVTKAIRAAPAVLESSPVVVFFKERGEKEARSVVCRQIAMHAPPFNAWGVQFRTCGNSCKDVLPTDFSFRTDKGAIRCHCAMCGWKSCRVRHDDVLDMVPVLSPDLPLVYHHPYPPSFHLLDTFARISKERRE